jgi:hypothetical protein
MWGKDMFGYENMEEMTKGRMAGRHWPLDSVYP